MARRHRWQQDATQCLLFVERESTLNSNEELDSDMTVESYIPVNENSETSTPFVKSKIYALFPPKPDTHPFYRTLAQNGIELIVNNSVIPSQDARLQVVEFHVYIPAPSKVGRFLDKEETNPKSVRIYHGSDEKFLRKIFSSSCDVDYRARVLHNHIMLDHTKTEVLSKVSLKLIEAWLAPRVDVPFRHAEGGTLLHFAAESGYTDLFELLIKLGADIHQRRTNGETPLHLAAGQQRKYQCRAIVESLLKNGAIVNSKMANGSTPLHGAANAGFSEIVKLLLKHGATVDAEMDDGSTPLHKGTGVGSMEIVRMLVQAGAEVNARTKDGATPLHIAAGLGKTQTSLVEFLIRECGANVHATDASGRTPILCTKKHHPQVIQLLVENGADSNAQSKWGETLLSDTISSGGYPETLDYVFSLQPRVDLEGKTFYLALRSDGYKYEKVVQYMINGGFVPTVGPKDANNSDMLFGAIQKHVIEVVRALVNYGANVNQFYSFGTCGNLTPLYMAIQAKNTGIVQLILDAGGNVNVTRGSVHNLITPLSYAVEYSTVEIVKILMAADPKDREDPRLLEHAVAKAGPSMVEFLLEKGFDPNFVNVRGQSLMAAAVRYGNVKAIELLARFGAQRKLADLTMDRMKVQAAVKAFLDHCFTSISRDDEIALAKLFGNKPYSSKKYDFHKGECAEMLAEHLVKFEVVYKYVSAKELVSFQLYKKYQLAAFKEDCISEIESMKTKTFSSTEVTLYDILTKDSRKIACYARNRDIVETLESPQLEIKYPIYAGVLCGRILEGKNQNTLLEEGMEAFKSLSKCAWLPKLPDDVIMIVFNFLNNEDLFVLRKCSPA